jgi:hypothetical protein
LGLALNGGGDGDDRQIKRPVQTNQSAVIKLHRYLLSDDAEQKKTTI